MRLFLRACRHCGLSSGRVPLGWLRLYWSWRWCRRKGTLWPDVGKSFLCRLHAPRSGQWRLSESSLMLHAKHGTVFHIKKTCTSHNVPCRKHTTQSCSVSKHHCLTSSENMTQHKTVQYLVVLWFRCMGACEFVCECVCACVQNSCTANLHTHMLDWKFWSKKGLIQASGGSTVKNSCNHVLRVGWIFLAVYSVLWCSPEIQHTISQTSSLWARGQRPKESWQHLLICQLMLKTDLKAYALITLKAVCLVLLLCWDRSWWFLRLWMNPIIS